MHNNLIYLTDGRGKTDAAEMTDSDWDQLVVDNRNSTRRRLVKCAWCWDDDQITHWMKTYNNAHGKRVVSHQPGEAGDHPYQALESDEHKAYCDRVERVGTEEGYSARREARAADGRTRSDVLLLGTRHVAYEMQHSPFKTGYGATERTRKSLAAKRDAVAWHTDSGIIAGAARVAMLRSNQAQLPQIENPRYQIRILGGFRQIAIWTCTTREGYRCPNGRFSGCGQTHLDTAPTGITLDDFIRQAPAGTLLPVLPLQRRGFWTTAADYQRWTDYNAGKRVLDVDQFESRDRLPQEGYGHSRPASVKNYLPSVPPQRTMRSFASARTCEAGRTPCGQPARLYAAGWRCEEHRPSSH
ncbi:hypothetical protein OEB94_14465 [Streptomyces sp. ICN988]|uniref:hypothetical protein n=1 Tax=Streptomyces sp. ICN988 TaxID=2983765 RepID=UPI0021E4730C|nr:hypothetical protein [Streptomyces sp. ICN988]MCV2460481.1 hypothetical protein [Streptomyces sp. ICN988]